MKRTNTNASRTVRPRTISFVGSGNVATHLALALQAAGNTICQIFSREYDHAARLAARVGASSIDRADLLRDDAEVYILAVSDDALYELPLDLNLPQALVLHTSGSTPASVLNHVSRKHGVVWSPQTFVRDIAIDYSRMPLCIEGSTPQVAEEIEMLFAPVTQRLYRLDFEQRRHAHLAAVMVSNFVNALNAQAQQLMQEEGLDFDILRPLAEETLRKWDFGDLRSQQTGPAARHDSKTLAAQRKLLADKPQLLQLYDLMTEIIQQP